jgi:DNA-directed RNA polymerase alpha subunit
VEELAAKSDSELLRIPNFGRQSLDRLRDLVRRLREERGEK